MKWGIAVRVASWLAEAAACLEDSLRLKTSSDSFSIPDVAALSELRYDHRKSVAHRGNLGPSRGVCGGMVG